MTSPPNASGRHEILAPIGAGVMGRTVERARDTHRTILRSLPQNPGGSFLIVTPQGSNVLIDSTCQRNVRTIQRSIEQLGFKFPDAVIVLGNHAHSDHTEVKELTGAQVLSMAEDTRRFGTVRFGPGLRSRCHRIA
jgi:glyoxylase-like metal-dependent hydrolase (beta-lactamase superfamily II)